MDSNKKKRPLRTPRVYIIDASQLYSKYRPFASSRCFLSVSKLGYLPNQSATINVTNNEFIDSDVTLLVDPQSNTGTISGIITNLSTGNPVTDAGVALYSVTGTAPNEVETVIATTRTNAGGRYLFANVIPGKYRVKSNKQEVIV